MGFLERIKSLNPYKTIVDLKKSVSNLSGRIPEFIRTMSHGVGHRDHANNNLVLPYYLWPTNSIYDLAYHSDVVTTVHRALREEVFRNGMDVIEADQAGQDTTSLQEEFKPSDEDKAQIMLKLADVNANKQTVIEVFKEIEDDLNIVDDGWGLYVMDYEFNGAGEIIQEKSELKEFVRADPRSMGFVQNSMDIPGLDDEGRVLSACPEHRDTILTNTDVCPQCEKRTRRVFYVHKIADRQTFYFQNEIVHVSKFRPNKRHGFPPMITLWQKISTLNAEDKYILEYYRGQRQPKGMLVFSTSNQASARKGWDLMLEKRRENPHEPAVLAIENQNGGKKVAEWIDFMQTLDEMQYTEQRNEFRRQIGALYGVLPMWQGDVSTSGGLNNEGLQVTVTNRAVEADQKIFNETFFPHLLKMMNIQGWVAKLNPSEEQDEMAELQREQLSLANGGEAARLGLEVEWDDDTGKATIKEGTITAPAVPAPFGQDPTLTEENPQEVSGTPEDPEDVSGVTDKSEKPSGKLLHPSLPSPKVFLPNLSFPDISNDLVAKARGRPPFTKLSKIIQKQIDKFVKRFKRKPSIVEMQKFSADFNKNLQVEIKSQVDKFFKQSYDAEVIRVEKELGVNFTFDGVDQNALSAISNQRVLSNAFDGISNKVSEKVKAVIQEAYVKPASLDLQKIIAKIQDISSVADFHAETIARTETSKVAAAARRTSYKKEDKDDQFVYKWIGPNDSRTTGTSKTIKDRTKNGVGWDELVKIVIEESAKSFPEWTVNPDAPVSHYSSRHIFVRLPGTSSAAKSLVDAQLDFAIQKEEIKMMKEKKALIKELGADYNGRT